MRACRTRAMRADGNRSSLWRFTGSIAHAGVVQPDRQERQRRRPLAVGGKALKLVGARHGAHLLRRLHSRTRDEAAAGGERVASREEQRQCKAAHLGVSGADRKNPQDDRSSDEQSQKGSNENCWITFYSTVTFSNWIFPRLDFPLYCVCISNIVSWPGPSAQGSQHATRKRMHGGTRV